MLKEGFKKLNNGFILFSILLLISISSCTIPHNYYSAEQPQMTSKEKVVNFTKYIITEDEEIELAKLNSDNELGNFLIKFWAKRDTSANTELNEFKEEYVKRFTMANAQLGGWQTDQGRVYILNGKPETIITQTFPPDIGIMKFGYTINLLQVAKCLLYFQTLKWAK